MKHIFFWEMLLAIVWCWYVT